MVTGSIVGGNLSGDNPPGVMGKYESASTVEPAIRSADGEPTANLPSDTESSRSVAGPWAKVEHWDASEALPKRPSASAIGMPALFKNAARWLARSVVGRVLRFPGEVFALRIRFLQLVEHAPQGIVVCVSDRIVFANGAAARAFGLPSVAELLAHGTFRSLVGRVGTKGPFDLPVSAEQAQAGLAVSELEVALPASGGRWIRLVRSPIVWDGRRAVRFSIFDVTERRQAESESRARERLLQDIVESLPCAVFVKDPERRYRLMNREFLKFYGGKPQDYLGKRVEDVDRWAPEHVAETREQEMEVLEGGRELVIPHCLRTNAQGRSCWVRGAKTPLRDEQGRIVGLLGAFADITAHRETQQLLQTVFDTMPMELAVRDAQGKLLMASRALADTWYRTPEQLVGKSIAELTPLPEIPAEELDTMLTMDREVIASGCVVDYEMDRTLPHGVRRFRVLKAPIRDAEGRPTAVLSMSEDVTERRQIAEQNRRDRQLLQHVFDTIPQSLIVKDPAGRILMANRGFTELFSLSPENSVLEGRRCIGTLDPVTVARIFDQDRQVLEGGETVAGEHVAIDRPGRGTLHLRVTKIPLTDAEGEISGLLGMFDDVTNEIETERRKAELESALQQARKLEVFGQLAAGVAHDFNNLLTPILGHSELLESEVPSAGKARESLEIIRRSAERAADLTRSLLAFGRKQAPVLKDLNLNSEVTSLVPILRHLIGKQVEVRTRLDPELGYAWADPSQIQQVLLNLSVNARDAMPDGGVLTLQTADARIDAPREGLPADFVPGSYVALTVSDTGTGMDAETRRKIFEPFFTTKPPGKGTGLGLSIVFRIVAQHKGYILVNSEPHQGSSFTVYLPRKEFDSAGPESIPEPKQSVRGHECVLVVDDEEDIWKFTQSALAAQGYDAVSAASPESALALIEAQTQPFTLLITDLIMPGMNGLELARRARQAQPTLKVLVISGDPRNLGAELESQEHPLPLLPKPFSVDALYDKVREVLDGAKPSSPKGMSPPLPA